MIMPKQIAHWKEQNLLFKSIKYIRRARCSKERRKTESIVFDALSYEKIEDRSSEVIEGFQKLEEEMKNNRAKLIKKRNR